MGHFKQGEFDFIDRTLKILKQYEDLDLTSCDDEKYEVTLLMNCFLGLIVIPQEVWFNDIPKEPLNNDWYIKNSQVQFSRNDTITIQELIEQLRNAIAHGDMTPLSKDKGKKKRITHVEFKGYTNKIKQPKYVRQKYQLRL